MTDTFYPVPITSSTSPLAPLSSDSDRYYIREVVTPIVPLTTSTTITPVTITSPFVKSVISISPFNKAIVSYSGPTYAYPYDSGIGESFLAISEVNEDLRYRFLDDWLPNRYPELLQMLKIENGVVKIASEAESEKNDVSKDTKDMIEKKIDFIGNEILTLSKNKKILNAMVLKNGMKWYDLPHNRHHVRKEQAKYVKRKLREMRDEK